MINKNLIIILSSICSTVLLLCTVFVNINIKESKKRLEAEYNAIEEIKKDVKHLKIDIAVLTSPYRVMKYIDDNQLKVQSVYDVEILRIEE